MKDVLVVVRKHPWGLAYQAFVAFSVLWTIIDGINHFVPAVEIRGYIAFTGVVVICLLCAAIRLRRPSKIEISVLHSDCTIEVVFGDIFEQEGMRAIAVNEFFDSQLGKLVSDRSLHGMLIMKCFGGHPEAFDRQIDEQLREVPADEVERVQGKRRSFPIGTCVSIIANQNIYLVFVLSKTDPMTNKAFSDVQMLLAAMNGLWNHARIESGGQSINVPLIGSGLSGIGLPARDILNLCTAPL